jgi:DNA polymerase III subunit beta
MKAQINRNVFNSAIESAMLAISPKPVTPVVGCIIINADSDNSKLTIKSTNTSFSIYQIIDAEVELDGIVAIPGKILKETIASLTGELSLEFDGNYLVITHETGQCRLMVNCNGDEFPNIEDSQDDEQHSITIPSLKLQTVIDSVLYAASTDEIKMILNGVNFSIANDELIAVTTDGHRVARVCANISDNGSDALNFTIPAKMLTEVSKILLTASDSNDCIVNVCDSIVSMSVPGVKMICRLITGQYPAIETLIPRTFKHEYTIERKALVATLKRVLNLADKKGRAVAVAWDIENRTAVLTTESSDFGDATDAIAFKPQTTTNQNSSIGFNIDYLTDAINAISTDEVVIKCNESQQPVIVCPIGGLLDQLALVMPMEIRRSSKVEPTPTKVEIEVPTDIPTDVKVSVIEEEAPTNVEILAIEVPTDIPTNTEVSAIEVPTDIPTDIEVSVIEDTPDTTTIPKPSRNGNKKAKVTATA